MHAFNYNDTNNNICDCSSIDSFYDSCKARNFYYSNYHLQNQPPNQLFGLASNSGWDTVSLIRQDIVNKQIANRWNQINSKIHYTIEDLTIDCDFFPWEITAGGSGKNIRFLLPIKSGTMIFSGKKIIIDQAKLVVSFMFHFNQLSDASESLKFHFKTLNPNLINTSTESAGIIYPIEVIDLQSILSNIQKALLLNGVCQYLIEHSDQINYIFATVNLMKSSELLTPYKSDYSYQDIHPGYLSILSVCSNRDISTLNKNLSFQIRNTNTTGIFSIDASYYLNHIVKSSLIKLFTNSLDTSYTVIDAVLTNTETITMNKMVRSSINYYPKITALTGQIIGNTLKMAFSGNCDLHANINMHFEATIFIQPYLENDVIKYKLSQETQYHRTYSVPWYLKALFGIASIIANFLSTSIVKEVVRILEMNVTTLSFKSIQWNSGNLNNTLNDVYFSKEFLVEFK